MFSTKLVDIGTGWVVFGWRLSESIQYELWYMIHASWFGRYWMNDEVTSVNILAVKYVEVN